MPKKNKAKPTKPKKWKVKSSQNEKGHRANVGTRVQPSILAYTEVRNKIPGEYQDGYGYTFKLSQKQFEYLFNRFVKIEVFKKSDGLTRLKDKLALQRYLW